MLFLRFSFSCVPEEVTGSVAGLPGLEAFRPGPRSTDHSPSKDADMASSYTVRAPELPIYPVPDDQRPQVVTNTTTIACWYMRYVWIYRWSQILSGRRSVMLRPPSGSWAHLVSGAVTGREAVFMDGWELRTTRVFGGLSVGLGKGFIFSREQ